MAKGPIPSASRTLTSLQKNCTRLERALVATRGEPADTTPLRQREQALRAELKALRAVIARRKKNPPPAVADDPVLTSLHDSILALSRNLGIAVALD